MYRFFVILIWLLLSSSHIIKAQKEINVNIEQNRKVNLCKYRGDEVIITVNIGEIAKSDELFGYELGLSFDNTKLDLNKFLPNGTLTEFFDIDKRGMNVITEGNVSTLDVYAVTFSLTNSIAGKLPLIAFGGKFIGECNDSTEIFIEWIDFTDEFKPIINDVSSLIVDSTIPIDTTIYMKSLLKNEIKDSVEYDSTATLILGIEEIKNGSIDKFIMNFSLEEGFEIVEIKQINNDFIYSIIESDNNYLSFEIQSSKLDEIQDMFEVKIRNVLQIESHIAKAFIEFNSNEECNCIKTFYSDSTQIQGYYKKPTYVNDFTKNYSISINDGNIIISSDEKIKQVQLYNILGAKIFDFYNESENQIIKINEELRGIYFLRITNDRQNIIEKIILN